MDEDIIMSDFVASRLGDLLSSVPILADDQPSESINPEKDQFPVTYVAKATKPRPVLGSEWSQLKGLLRYLYIEKDQTLRIVQRYLRERHSLVVTEKQLTRKFSDWNFRKNVKKCQRKALIQEYRVTEDTQSVQSNCGKINQQKLIRWERELTNSSRPKSHLWFNESSASLTGDLESIHISEQMELLLTDTNSTSGVVDNQEEDTTILIAKLFAKLGLNAPADIESWQTKVQFTEETTASHDDLVPFTSIHSSVLSGSSTYTMVTIRLSTPKQRFERVKNQKIPQFKWDNMDVMFSNGLWVEPSPYNELYPFASNPQRAKNELLIYSADASFDRIVHKHLDSSHSDLQESLCKIEKLRQLCQGNHEGLISEMWMAADIYWDKSDYSNAEHWCKEIVKRLASNVDFYPLWIMSRLSLSTIFFMQKKRKEAKEENQAVKKLLSDSNIVNQRIIESNLNIGAHVAEDLGENEDSEQLFKQLAQLRLTTYGPRSENSISTLRYLSEALLRQRKYSESEELLWILIALSKTNPNSVHRETTRVAFLLANVMFKQGRFKDAEVWWKKSLQVAETHWGSNDSLALEAETGLAITLKSQNRLEEGERLLRSNVEKLVRARGENSLTAARPMRHLGSLLMDENRYEDAMIWFEKCFKIRLLKLGPTDELTFDTFSYLIDCYLRMERREDASNSIQEYLEAIKKVCEVHEYISELETWMEDICEGIDL